MKSDKERIKQLADEIVHKLKQEGFIIQRYDAYSTNSVYLKFDYGVCKSLRISNHKGKKHLQYRYNLIVGNKGYGEATTEEGWKRFYFPDTQVDELIRRIMWSRNQLIKKYGEAVYSRFIRAKKQEGEGKIGFWRKSVLA